MVVQQPFSLDTQLKCHFIICCIIVWFLQHREQILLVVIPDPKFRVPYRIQRHFLHWGSIILPKEFIYPKPSGWSGYFPPPYTTEGMAEIENKMQYSHYMSTSLETMRPPQQKYLFDITQEEIWLCGCLRKWWLNRIRENMDMTGLEPENALIRKKW